MTLPAFKRPDGVNDRVYHFRPHRTVVSAPCYPDPDTLGSPDEVKDVSPRPIPMHVIRRELPDRWRDVIKRQFPNAEDLASFMECDERTARYWLEGKHAPAAAFVLRLVTAFPHTAAELMGDDE